MTLVSDCVLTFKTLPRWLESWCHEETTPSHASHPADRAGLVALHPRRSREDLLPYRSRSSQCRPARLDPQRCRPQYVSMRLLLPVAHRQTVPRRLAKASKLSLIHISEPTRPY